MRRALLTAFVLVFALATLLGGRALRTGAHQDEEDDETQAVTLETLGSGNPAAATDKTLGLYRVTIQPGGEIPLHSHPGSLVVFVLEGELGYTLQEGEANVFRAPVDGEPGPTEPLVPGEESILLPGDYVFEEDVVHTARNVGETPVVIVVSGLTDADRAFLELVEEDGAAAEEEPAGSAEGTTVEVALSEFAIEMPDSVPAGPVTFVITNVGSVGHSFAIEGIEGGRVDGVLAPGSTATLELELPAGTFEVFCPVANHRELGMSLELTVTEDGAAEPAAETTEEPGATEEPEEAEATEEPEEEPAAAAVSIVDLAFEPAELEVSVGTSVTWTNDGAAPHTATGDAGEFDSDILETGDSFSFTFEEAGTFAYHCNVHPDMTATVVVS